MRILVISNYYPPFEIGGWEQLTHDVGQCLAKQGHQIHVLTSNHRAAEVIAPESGMDRVLHLESTDQMRYHPHYTLLARRHNQLNRQYLAKVVHGFAPDVIFVNGIWNLSPDVALHAEKLCPGQVVYYIASYWPIEQDAHSSYWLRPTRRPWLRWPKHVVGWLVRHLWLPRDVRQQLAFEHVLCVSEFMRQRLIHEAGIAQANTQVVYNGIEADTFKQRDLPGEPERPLKLLYAGRLSPDKGVHSAVAAFARFLEIEPNSQPTLSIVGGGDPTYEETLKQLAAQLQITSSIQFCGRVPREQMPAILAEHDVLLFPSIWPEPLARMTQEAMACGLVVIGTDTGGTPELLQDGHNGFTFAAGDAQMLSEKIAQVAANPDLRKRLAHAARHTIEQHFTLERMVDEIEEYLIMVVNKLEEQTFVPS